MKDFGKLSPEQIDIASQIAEEAIAQGVDPELALAVGFVENKFRASGISPKGAIGPMQVLPSNAKGYNMEIKDLYDPTKNIQTGIKILKEKLNVFQGNVRPALAAYNGRMERAKNYYEKGEDFNALAPETRQYLEDIDALHNTDGVGYLNKDDLKPVGATANKGPSKFGELPPPMEGQAPIADVTQSQEPPPKFGHIDENKIVEQEEAAKTAPPPEPSVYDQLNKKATDVYKAATENPELTGAVAASGTAGVLLGKYGKDTLDKQTEVLNQAKRDVLLAETSRDVGNRNSFRFTGESSQALDELDDALAQRKQNLVLREEELRKLQAQLADKAPPDLKGSQKWTDTLGGDDVPFEQKRQAENMRGDNPKGGQAIIDKNTAAKQRLEKMGLGKGFSLTPPVPGQLSLPDDISAEKNAKFLAEQQAQSKALLEAERKAEIARQEMTETQRAREQAAKAHAKAMASSSKSAAELGGDVEIARTMEADAAKRAPTGLGKAGVFAGKVAGKTIGALSGIALPLAADEAAKRFASGDKVGGVIATAEVVLAAMAMLPPGTPITAAMKAVGIGGGLAVATLDYLRNRESKPAKPAATAPKPAATAPKPPSGGLSQYQERKPNGIYKDAYGRYHG